MVIAWVLFELGIGLVIGYSIGVVKGFREGVRCYRLEHGIDQERD